MYKWYTDDSALKKNYGDSKRPVFLYGGILISRSDEIEINLMMKRIKSQYTSAEMPIKYNIKDVEEVYQRFEKESEFEVLKNQSVVWRKQIIEESLRFNYTIFISCIENFQADKKEQKEIKQNLSSFLFSNALMRVGIFANSNNLEHIQVVLDWPESNDSRPFDKEYFYGYNRGVNSNSQNYFCGPLNAIGFEQNLFYARCNHSNLLQLTDIILGATRDWLETELQGRDYSIGKELSQLFISKFYNYPDILNYGINISANNASFKKEVKLIIDKSL